MTKLSGVGTPTMPRLEGIQWMLVLTGLLVALSATPVLAQTQIQLMTDDEDDAGELFDSLDTSKNKAKPVSMSGSFNFDHRKGLTLNGERVYLTPMTLVMPDLGKGREYTERDLGGRTGSVMARRSVLGYDALIVVLEARAGDATNFKSLTLPEQESWFRVSAENPDVGEVTDEAPR